MQLEHTHIGEPTYLAYTGLKCRHPACYAAYCEYKERLAERKISGAFKDMRLAENKPANVTLESFIERLRNDPELAGQLIPVLAGTVLTEVATDEPDVQSERPTEPGPTTDTPAREKPLQALPAAPVTLLGLLAELADSDGAISPASVTANAKEFAAKLGLEPLQFTAQLVELVETKQLGFGVTMVKGRPLSVYRMKDAA